LARWNLPWQNFHFPDYYNENFALDVSSFISLLFVGSIVIPVGILPRRENALLRLRLRRAMEASDRQVAIKFKLVNKYRLF
jgi:hypothetical protein